MAEPALLPKTMPMARPGVGDSRRARHLAAIASGRHPLSLALAVAIPLHPQARRDGDRVDDGSPRCGSCQHRWRKRVGDTREYPKCRFGADGDGHLPRASGVEDTDIAAWFPACRDYEPKEAPYV